MILSIWYSFGDGVSRLARNNRDWYHLMDLVVILATLLAAGESIYDLKFYNDRFAASV